MASRSTKRSSKKSEVLPGKLASQKMQQIEQFYGIGGDESKNESAGRISKSPSAKRSQSSTSSAVQLLKKMAKHKKELNDSKDFQEEEDEQAMEGIPDTLDDLNSRTAGEGHKGEDTVQVGHELDEILDSETAKRIQTDSEVTIQFFCPLLANVGSVGQLFCIDDLSLLKSLLAHCSVPLSPFLLLFFCRPHSRLRCAFFERFRQRAVGGAIGVPYDVFMFALCYAFQVSPIALHTDKQTDDSFVRQLDEFAALFAPIKVRWAQQKRRLCYANIELLLNVWHFLRFDHWTDGQIVALCRALARLYLDVGAREFRAKISRAFHLIFLHFPSSVRRRSVLSHFLSASFFSSADHCVHAAFVLFQMISQSDQFDQSLRLLAIQSVLKTIVSRNDASGKKKAKPLPPFSVPFALHLGDASDCLSEAVSVVRRWATAEDEPTTDQTSSSSLTVVYLLYNRWLDTLTADERLLISRNESEASLEKALQNIRQANEQLNRRNINDKMIHTWAQSEHRIRAALLRRQRGQLRMSQMGNAERKNTSSSSKIHTFVGSSSEDDDE